MRKNVVLGCGFLVLAAAMMILSVAASDDSANAAKDPGVPAAVFSETKHTWQKAIEGEKIKHTFMVRNKGTAELIIEQVKTS